MTQREVAPSLHAALERWAACQPQTPFIVETETRTATTYGAFARAVRALRTALGSQQRTVLVALPGGLPAAVVWLAALTGGHRLIPCSPTATDEERRRLGERQRPDVLVVTCAEEAEPFACPWAGVYTAAEVAALAAHTEVSLPPCGVSSAFEARDGCVRLTTSGTTGEPKGVVLSASQVAWTADAVRTSHRLTPRDRGLCVLPFWHINAPVVSLCATLLAGATVVVAPRFSVHRFWEWVERERITWASVVPTIIALLNRTDRPTFLPGTLRFVRTASAPLPVAYLRAFEARFGVPVVETYGLSEAASQVTANPVPPARRKAGSVGVPVGVELRVCEQPTGGSETDPEQPPQPVAPSVEGEICVRGPSVIAGYEDGRGAASFAGGWFRTGDLGYLDGDGYLYITGRLRDVINRGGEKVAPREIEETLLAHPLIADAAVAGKPHALYGQRVVAYIVPRGDWDELAEHHLRDYCAERLSAYKVPETFYAVASLPRNGNGKLARAALERAPVESPLQTSPAQSRGVLAHG